MENNTGTKTVPCETPLSISTNFVVTLLTTTLCLWLLKKLIILMLYNLSLLHKIWLETKSKALLRSKEYTLTKSTSLSNQFNQ